MVNIFNKKIQTNIILAIFTFFFPVSVWAGTATLNWHPNGEPDLAGYKVYYGTSSRNYTAVEDVGDATQFQVTTLTEGQTYFFALTAYDIFGNESTFSGEASKLIGAAVGDGSGEGMSFNGGGGCGMLRNISGGSGLGAGQAALSVTMLLLPFLFLKLRYLLKRFSEGPMWQM